jgi:glycosyltransferase involved in cell wall biosynthesis
VLSDQIRARHRAHPDHLFVFTPYLFGTTYWGAYVAPERALLVPCLHDEGFARMVALRELFRTVRGVLCNSAAEMRLVRRLYDVPPSRLAVVGDGIEWQGQGEARTFRERFDITAPFILYVGRKSSGKNVPLLLNYFHRYRRRRETDLELVLIGPGQVSVSSPGRRAVHDLGFVTEEDKRHACAAADVLCQPSVNESFSLVLMEAWMQGTPVLVNARCEVTREHCQYSQGGLYFNGYQEFEATLDWMLAHPAARRRMGTCGRRYVEQNYTWEKVMKRFLNAVQALGS